MQNSLFETEKEQKPPSSGVPLDAIVSKPLLLHGDCLVESNNIDIDSVDLILADLPYGTINGIKNVVHGMAGRCEWDIVIDAGEIMRTSNRILRKNGKMVLFAQDPFSTVLKNNATANLAYNYSMVWEKDHFANSLVAKKAPVSYTEDILVFSKGPHGTYGDDDSYREYLNRERIKAGLTLDEMCGLCGLNTKGHGGAAYHWCSSLQPSMIPEKHYNTLREKTPFFTKNYNDLKATHKKSFEKYRSTFNLWEGNKYKSNILKYKKDYDGHHPTQKPILLLEDLIKTFSNAGDTIVDLTMGSGSTGVAAGNTGRSFIGIEMDLEYYQIATKRIEAC